MDMKIVGLDGNAFTPPPPEQSAPNEPIAPLISMLEDLLKQAQAGEVRALVGCGIMADGRVYTVIAEDQSDYRASYTILGAVNIVKDIYTESILERTFLADESTEGDAT